MPAFYILLKFHHVAWCNNGQGTSPSNIHTSIEPMPRDIIHRKRHILGEGEIARAIQESNCHEDYSKGFHTVSLKNGNSLPMRGQYYKKQDLTDSFLCAVDPPFSDPLGAIHEQLFAIQFRPCSCSTAQCRLVFLPQPSLPSLARSIAAPTPGLVRPYLRRPG